MKRLVSMLIAVVFSMCCWASQLVLLGSYRNDADGKEYDVYLHLEGKKYEYLEICAHGTDVSSETRWVVVGTKSVKELREKLLDIKEKYSKWIDLTKENKVNVGVRYIDVKWPKKMYLDGIISGVELNYEHLDIHDFSLADVYYTDVNTLNFVLQSDGQIVTPLDAECLPGEYKEMKVSKCLTANIIFKSLAAYDKLINLLTEKNIAERLKYYQ